MPQSKKTNERKPLISFDYAIKFLLKNKSDYAIVEGFISAVLATKGYKPVKIISLLESESSKEEKKDKRSLADVIVEDEDKRKYIIEIERNISLNFISKACFNTSRLIVDNIKENADYTEIKKVFHISLLFFSVGRGPIHHGKTVVHEVETNEKLTLHITDKKTQSSYDITEVFPEYFFISVPLFNDRLRREVDEWLYLLKYDEIPKSFKSKYMASLEERLSILKMSKEQYHDYLYYKKKVINDREELYAAEMIGIEKGIKQGIEEGKRQGIEEGKKQGMEEGKKQGMEERELEIAKSLLKMHINPEEIAKATNISIDVIKSLM